LNSFARSDRSGASSRPRTNVRGRRQRQLSRDGYTFNKATVYKRKSRNHLDDQIESFRIGDKDNKREDDLLDTFAMG
jgi:hypothetical protein